MHKTKALLLLLALAAQVPHAAALFHRLAPATDGPLAWLAWLHALSYAIALEGAIWFFVQRGKPAHSWGFALASIATNALYYWRDDGMSLLYISRFALASIMLPLAIALYSHEDVQEQEQPKQEEQEAPAKQEQATEQPRQEQASPLLTLLVQEQATEQEQAAFVCKHPGCAFTGSNRQQLAAHSRKHRIAIAAD